MSSFCSGTVRAYTVPARRRGLGQVMTSQHLLVGGEDAEPASNRRGGRGMITGDDHRDDAGGACCGDRW